MKISYLMLTVAPFALISAAQAKQAPAGAERDNTAQAVKKVDDSDMVTTGVARGRDRLDSATSTSSIKEIEIQKLSARSLGEVFRNIPGVRAEIGSGEGSTNISIRGLPIATTGAKYLQMQEDGLPVIEFGDINYATSDQFLRADLNLAQIEAIRGGSASTFSSNSPGGVINLISKTGDIEGGSVQFGAGLNYEDYRADFDYGAKISDTLRFHVGGFYRQGEGPRKVGYDAYKGGQIKLNITKEFSGGYIRFYGKILDDRTPFYSLYPIRVSGTDSNPSYGNIANFDVKKDTLASRNLTNALTLDGNNNAYSNDLRDGQRSLVKSFGVETQFELSDWTITDRFRFSNISGGYASAFLVPFSFNSPFSYTSFGDLTTALGQPGATLRYANGPNAGAAISNPDALNGNGLLAQQLIANMKLNSVDNITNDLRASRTWQVGGGNLTTTAGFYKSRQAVDIDWSFNSVLTDVVGGGNGALLELIDSNGNAITQDGNYRYGALGGQYRRRYNVDYNVNAAFGSVNFHKGRVAIGGSLRYDFGNASGSVVGSDLGGTRVGTVPRDMNGDGIISQAEQQVDILPLGQPAPVDYNWHYLSYSAGINFRIAEPISVFARYSRGARANADRLLFSAAISPLSGNLLKKDAVVDFVRQAEAGVKYRKSGLTLNLTGFWASTLEHNVFYGPIIARKYRAFGAEFEGGLRKGPFSFTAGATFTDAKILSDDSILAVAGNTPQRQPKLSVQATPQVITDRFSVGAVFFKQTGTYATDINQLKVPGYTTVNPFVQYRPVDRLMVSLNVNNLFNVLGISYVEQGNIPANGIINAQVINGRTISSSVRFSF